MVKEARLLRVAAQSLVADDRAVRDAPGFCDGALAQDYSVKLKQAIDLGVDLLMYIGSVSPRFVELFGPDGTSSPPSGLLESFRLVVRGDVEAACLRDFCRESRRFFVWAFSMKLDLLSLPSLALVGYLRNIRCRGKSVPTRVRCALVWSEAVFRISLNASSRDIISLCVRLSRVDLQGRAVRGPVQAVLVPPEVVAKLELLVTTAPTLPMRIFAGVAALCAGGIKRWSDVQHVKSWFLAPDALVVKWSRGK